MEKRYEMTGALRGFYLAVRTARWLKRAHAAALACAAAALLFCGIQLARRLPRGRQ
ncbi:MAG: hypothetical protein LBQ33_01220 [Oscillospiraceae bacterium]|jgi:hypothetical protein|nr:hypothetical protein [Oscillospiraceae bacterium]